MYHQHKMRPLALIPIVIALSILTLATASDAGEFAHERQGFIIGLSTGSGCGGLEYEQGGKTIEIDELVGSTGTFRIGYGFSDSWTLTLDAQGFEHDSRNSTMELGSAVIAGTWYPRAGGFFVRLGLGGGESEVRIDDIDSPLNFKEEGGVIALGLGYEWRVSRNFALGLGLEARGYAFDDFDGLKEMTLGNGNCSILMTWYL